MEEARRKRILMVEDDARLATFLKRTFEEEGFGVDVDSSGAMALAHITDYPPDLVLLDLKLPDLHGYEVCKAIRKHYHSWVLPIVMLTGLTNPIDRLRGFAYGADAYLTKPCGIDELLTTVRDLLMDAPTA